MRIIALVLLVVTLANCKTDKMDTQESQIIIRNQDNNIVAEIGIKEDQLHGLCIWYDSEQSPIVCGLFNNGRPYSGTFANWSLIAENWPGDAFTKQVYCDDWVSFFEASYVSNKRSFNEVIQTYVAGVLVNN